MVQAALPHFRERKSGTFGFIGAGFGWASFPFMAHYGMAKGALTSKWPEPAEGGSNETRRRD